MKHTALAFVVGCLAIGTVSLPALAQTALVEGGGEPLGLHVDFKDEATVSGTLQWSTKVSRIGAGFLRLHFANLQAASEQDFNLVVRDRSGHSVMQVSSTAKGSFWTPIIGGDVVQVDVYANARPTGLSFDIDRLVFQRLEGVKYSIRGEDNREEVYKMTPVIRESARAVGKLQFVADDVPKSCTGFLIGPNLFMTNNHCVKTQEECGSAVVTFGYQYDANGTLSLGDGAGCKTLAATDVPLDFSVLELDRRAGDIWGTLTLADQDPKVGDPGVLIEHGGGMPKQVSRKGCQVTTEPADGRDKNTDIGHICATLEGASGAPLLGLFGTNFRVIGLHHWGFEAPGLWSQENRAVRATKICDRLLALGVLR